MIDLMPCQMCDGGKPHLTDCNTQVFCGTCAVVGQASFSHYASDPEATRSDYEREAAESWNRMQAAIARGILVEAMPTAKGARL